MYCLASYHVSSNGTLYANSDNNKFFIERVETVELSLMAHKTLLGIFGMLLDGWEQDYV